MTVSQKLQLGLADHQAGRLAEAEAIYRAVLAQQPENVDALHLLGVLLGQRGKSADGIELIRRAIELRPDYAEALTNLGNLLLNSGNAAESLASLRRAVELKPEIADAHLYLGNALLALGKLDEAIDRYQQTILLKPDFAPAYVNLGTALRDKRQLDEAIESYQRAIAAQPTNAMAHSNLASALAEVGRFSEAVTAYRKALALNPDYLVAHSNLIFLQMYLPDHDAGMIRAELTRWNERFTAPLRKFIRPHTNDRDPDRRLRIGYVSPDFREHCQSFFTLPLFRNHDRRQFEICCYSNVNRPDATSERIRACVDQWRPIVGITDEAAADLIRANQIDILVDLTMHMSGGRPLIFARKPAPVQVAWLAYPGSTGIEAMDYRLTDPYLDPPGEGGQNYSEQSIRLPKTFWCFEPSIEIEVNALPVEGNGYVTFGCPNNFQKVNEHVLRLWAKVLNAVPKSRMLLLCPEGNARQSVLDLFSHEGIDSTRIETTPNLARRRYFELYHHIDIGLDTFPYNGHTTSLDSYWMGVPVVTLASQRVVGRAGVSQLNNLGLPELIAATPEQYVSIAAQLAGDLPRLRKLRQTLRGRMESSPLMDAPAFAIGMEAAYRNLWKTHCLQTK